MLLVYMIDDGVKFVCKLPLTLPSLSKLDFHPSVQNEISFYQRSYSCCIWSLFSVIIQPELPYTSKSYQIYEDSEVY